MAVRFVHLPTVAGSPSSACLIDRNLQNIQADDARTQFWQALPVRGTLLLFAGIFGCTSSLYGHDGMRYFAEGSEARTFFKGCPYEENDRTGTWFCDTTGDYTLLEQKTPKTHEREVNAFILHANRGRLVGRHTVKLTGRLADMQVTTLGLEESPESQWVAFVATQSMPDASSIVVSCTLHAEHAQDVGAITKCHTGMALLRDAMRAKHQ